MVATRVRFDSRKEEINFYFRVMCDITGHKPSNETENNNKIVLKSKPLIETEDNDKFVRILKSNFLLMLYNLIESCVKSGFEEIYEIIKAEGISYIQVSNALRDIWSSYEISNADKDTAKNETYGKRVKDILEQVISNAPILLKKKTVEALAGGTLDARIIRELLKKHDINFIETSAGDKYHILTVKTKRNSLAHGEESFDEAARDLVIDDLEKIKNEVLIFVEDVINGIEEYYNNKLYLINNENI